MRLTFIVSLVAMALLFTTLWRLELAGKAAAARLRHLRHQLELPAHPAPRSARPQAPPVTAARARSSPR
jgi:hypothetical protein